ncbi:LOW QUALITY PROTEIN: MFS superfamily transporter, partial [Streptomyces sp. e14]
ATEDARSPRTHRQPPPHRLHRPHQLNRTHRRYAGRTPLRPARPLLPSPLRPPRRPCLHRREPGGPAAVGHVRGERGGDDRGSARLVRPRRGRHGHRPGGDGGDRALDRPSGGPPRPGPRRGAGHGLRGAGQPGAVGVRTLRAPDWTLFAAYAATATTPNTGGMSRARWAHLLRGDPAALHTANSFEQAADELCFMLGPVLAAFLTGTFFPEAGTLTGAVLLLTGTLLFTAQRATEPPAGGGSTGRAPLRAPGMPAQLAVCLALGAVFGAMEVVTVAFADDRGHRSAAGVALGLQAAGSCLAGLVYGALRPGGPAARRLPWCVAAMTALMTLPLLAAALTGSMLALSGALLVAGTATAPTMVTNMALVQQRTPAGRLNEGMTLAVTGLLGGIACGSATGGWVVEHLSPTAGYGVPVTAAAVALVISVARRTG